MAEALAGREKNLVLTVVGQTTEKSARFRKYRKKKLNPSKSKDGGSLFKYLLSTCGNFLI